MKTLQSEIAALRQAITEIALHHSDALVILAEIVARIDRAPYLREAIDRREGAGLAALSFADLRNSLEQTVDDLVLSTSALLKKS